MVLIFWLSNYSVDMIQMFSPICNIRATYTESNPNSPWLIVPDLHLENVKKWKGKNEGWYVMG